MPRHTTGSSAPENNPATGEPLATYDGWDEARTEGAVARAHAAARAWALAPVGERAARAARLARTLRQHKDRLAALAVTEMGKPITPRWARSPATTCGRRSIDRSRSPSLPGPAC
ncbi:aldehyde dehydrogenase family protein [Streptomyces sp. NPDC002888]|uniref:aldehyde dehydrogenase family protein n=1 Tax=Streptomyces sp. NPDC002888 TaxID=3364668 RepID=UPI0036C517E3